MQLRRIATVGEHARLSQHFGNSAVRCGLDLEGIVAQCYVISRNACILLPCLDVEESINDSGRFSRSRYRPLWCHWEQRFVGSRTER